MLKEIKVPEISCDHCSDTITNTLMEIKEVKTIEVEIPKKSVLIEYDKKIDMDQVSSLLLDKGYTVEPD
jgi:copper chaperone CopZ